MKDLKSIMLEHPFLKGMKAEHLDILARHAREAEFESGQVILRESQSAYEFYLIVDGQVAIESYVPRADDVPLQVVGRGDVLGWSWLFPPFNWHFQARALEPTKAIFLDGATLLIACEHNHHFGYELMGRIAQVIVSRLQATRKRLLKLQPNEGLLAAVDETRPLGRDNLTLTPKPLETMMAEHPFFKDMSPRHLKILADSAMQTEFAAGQLVFHEGDPANRFYLIQHGQVVLEIAEADRAPVPIQRIGGGDVLGWSWLFPPFYWHMDARALQPTRAIFLYGTRLREQCEADHDLGYELMKRLAQVLIHRLQATRRQLLELTSRGKSR